MSTNAQPCFDAALTEAAVFNCSSPFIFSISGADATRYLQGRITQTVVGLKPGDCTETLLLSPQGKIQGKLLLLVRESDYLALTFGLNKEARSELLKALFLFRVADQVEAVEQDELGTLLVIGPNAQAHVERVTTNSSHLFVNSNYKIPQYLIVDTQGNLKSIQSKLNELPLGTEDDYQLVRIYRGEPLPSVDITEKIIATDIPHRSMISFDKGCYAGQEVVEMSVARGRPNRRFVKITSAGNAPFTPGDEITASEKKVGFISSSSCLVEENKVLSLGFIKNGTDLSQEFLCSGTPIQIEDSLYNE